MSVYGRQLVRVAKLFLVLLTFVLTNADSKTAEGSAADIGLKEAVEKRSIHPLFGSHFLYKRLLRLPYQRRQDSRFTHSFVGKRSGDNASADDSTEDSDDETYENLLSEEKDKRAPAFSHRFVGKRQPSFSHRFVGKRTSDEQLIRDAPFTYDFVDKRGPNFRHAFVGKRAPSFRHKFVGKRAPSFQHKFIGKRAPAFSHRFVGKRFPEDEAAVLEYLNAEGDEDQDSYDFPHSIRKRDASSDQIEINQRAQAYSHPCVDKRRPTFQHSYVGKREDEQEQQGEQLEQQDVDSLAELL